MANISLEKIKELRNRTGVGVNHIKEALEETKGDIEKAVLVLRKKGIAKAAKRSDNKTSNGYIASYIHGDGQIGVLVEVNTETDFAARSDKVRGFVKDLTLHIAANNPAYILVEDVDKKKIEDEKSVYEKDLKGKPEEVKNKIVEGKLNKFYEDIVLMEQKYLKDDSKKVEDVVNELVAAVGEKIVIKNFVRFSIGGTPTNCSS